MKTIKNLLPKRKIDTHKHACGKVGVIAGSENMLGAAILASRAALRSGAGLVYLMTIESAHEQINIIYPEIIVLPLKSKNGIISEEAIDQIIEYHDKYNFSALAMGPGLSQTEAIKKLVLKTIKFADQKQIPTVLDADAINVLKPEDFKALIQNLFVLTPHFGEYKNFFGDKAFSGFKGRSPLENNLPGGKGDFVPLKNFNQIIVLKGHNTIIADANQVSTNKTGNTGMATAGTGDVLTGIIAGLIAQGVKNYNAALLGTYLHGLAGDLAAKEKTIYSLIASDLIEFLPNAFKTLC